MQEFKVGDWLIGPPVNAPTKITELISTHIFRGWVLGEDEERDFEFCKKDRIIEPSELGEFILKELKKIIPSEVLDRVQELNDGEMNVYFDIEDEIFYLNGFILYKDNEFSFIQ